MSNVIDFLEKLGSDARLLEAAKDQVALALADAQVEASASEAIMARSADDLYALLNIVPMACFQTMPDEEEEQEDEEGEDGEEKAKKPAHSASQSAVVARAADLA